MMRMRIRRYNNKDEEFFLRPYYVFVGGVCQETAKKYLGLDLITKIYFVFLGLKKFI